MIKVLNVEERFPELPEVEFHHSRHGIDVGCVCHICQGVLALFKSVTEVVDLDLGTIRSGHQANFYTDIDTDVYANVTADSTLYRPNCSQTNLTVDQTSDQHNNNKADRRTALDSVLQADQRADLQTDLQVDQHADLEAKY